MPISKKNSHPDFDEEVLLIFLGYSKDGTKAAETIFDLEKELQRELDKLKRVNRSAPYKRIKIWKWDSDASAQPGGQATVISPSLERCNIAVFVFKERIGEVAWHEINEARKRNPPIPILPFFPAQPPSAERLMESDAIDGWSDLVKKRNSLAENWTDPDSSALTPLPQYKDLDTLSRLAAERITNEIVRLIGHYTDFEEAPSFRRSTKKETNEKQKHTYLLGYSSKEQQNQEELTKLSATTSNLLSIAPADFERYSATVVPTLIDYKGGALIYDPTGRIFDLTANQRERFGPIVKLDPWSVLTPDSRGMDALNPFEIYESLGISINDCIRIISETFFPYKTYQYRRKELSNLDPFWPAMQRKLLVGLFHVAISEQEGVANIFTRVAKLVHSDDVVYNLAKKLDDSKAAEKSGKQEGIIGSEGYQEIAAFLQQADTTRSGIIAGVSHTLSAFLSARAQQVVDKTTFDIERWLQGDPMTIYIIGSPLAVSTLDSLFCTWMSSLQFALLQQTQGTDKSNLMVIDLHESFSIWSGLISAICHRSNIQTWILSTDVSELEWAFQEFSEQVVNSLGVFQIFKPRNWNSAKRISALINYPPEKLTSISDDECLSVIDGTEPVLLKHFE